MLMCRDCAIYNTWLCHYKDSIKAESSARNCPDFLMDAKKAFDRGKNEGREEAFKEMSEFIKQKSENSADDGLKGWIGEWG